MTLTPHAEKQSSCSVGEVLDRRADRSAVLVLCSDDGINSVIWARTTRTTRDVSIGDTVLILSAGEERHFVLDIVSSTDSPESCQSEIECPSNGPTAIQTCDGTQARLVERRGTQSLQLLSSDSTLLVEYDTSTGKTSIHTPADVQLTSATGNLDFFAARQIRLTGQSIRVSGQQDVTMLCSSGQDTQGTLVALDPSHARVITHDLSFNIDRAEICADQARLQTDRLHVQAENTRVSGTSLSIAMETLTEKLGDVYRTVRGLVQCLAGRKRTRVESSLHISAEQTYLHADEDVKIQGEQIHLG